MVSSDALNGRDAGLTHHQLQLATQDVEHGFDAFLSKRRESPDIRTADAHGGRAERERLEDVAAATEPAVHEHRRAAFDAGNDIRHAIGRASLDPSAQSFRVLSDLAAKLLPMALTVTGREHAACLQLVLSGPGGGEWTLALGPGADDGAQVQLNAAARDLCLLMGDRIDPRDFAYTVRGDEGASAIAEDIVAAAPSFARP